MTIIEVIRKGIKYAESYQLTDDDFILSIDDQISLCEIGELEPEYKPNYRDFLQQIIEGINRERSLILRCTSPNDNNYHKWWFESGSFISKEYDTPDECKLSAITYVLERGEK